MAETEAKRGRGRPAKVAEEPTVLIHFLVDQVTAFGTTWLAGQEVEVERDSDAFRSTLDRDGKSWLDQTEAQQKKAWGGARFAKGPSTVENPIINYKEPFDPEGVTYVDGEYYTLTMLKLRAEQEIARGRNLQK